MPWLQRRQVGDPELSRAAVAGQLQGSHAPIETDWPLAASRKALKEGFPAK
jgi:hypothetical protein